MKRISIALAMAVTLPLASCDELQGVAEAANEMAGTGTGGSQEQGLTNAEVVKGLKEALIVGTRNSADMTSKVDGFYKNPRIKLPFPPDAIKVKEKAEQFGLEGQVDKFVETLNRGAEEATKEAAPIFVNAVKEMSVQDGFAILKGDDNAATVYLKEKTTADLKTAFRPKVAAALEKVQITKYWNPLITKYNQATALTGGEDINPDLEEYVTERAIDGLFMLIADEEKKIRENPAARVNDILKKVFGSLDE